MEFVSAPHSTTKFYTPVNSYPNLRRRRHMLVGHSPLLSSFSACKSSIPPFAHDCLHHVFFLSESQYGIAIYLFRHLLLVYGWVVLHYTYTVRFVLPSCTLHVLIYGACTCEGLTTVRPLFESFQS